MITIASRLFLFILFAICIFDILFLIYSVVENEKRAVKRSIPILVLTSILLFILNFLPEFVAAFLLPVPVLSFLVLFMKFGNRKIDFAIPNNKYDERDVMFSRNTLKQGTPEFESYYKMRPENKSKDDNFRKEPGLLSNGSAFYNEVLFNAAKATFSTVDLLQPAVEQNAPDKKSAISSKDISEFIKKWTLKLGAERVGFTILKPSHIYSHIGRGERYGKEVKLNHKYAIAFTVEMSHESLSYNPKGPVVMESAQQYLNAGQIAVQVAQFIRNFGFEARAHIDANYRLICPIVARDAGLGTIGRMGLLMTPNLGPRVRIGVVSTNLKLDVNQKPENYSVIHFCEICKKCAVNCPSQSIPFHSLSKINNPERWTINQETCYTYWCKTGTDCGRCVAVCPYSHPDNFIHNIIRWMIKRNPVNRWIALKLDDFFYGRKPKAATLKNWMNAGNN